MKKCYYGSGKKLASKPNLTYDTLMATLVNTECYLGRKVSLKLEKIKEKSFIITISNYFEEAEIEDYTQLLSV